MEEPAQRVGVSWTEHCLTGPPPVARLILAFDEEPVASLVVAEGGRVGERPAPLFAASTALLAASAVITSVALDPASGAWMALGDVDGWLRCAVAPFSSAAQQRRRAGPAGAEVRVCAARDSLCATAAAETLRLFRVEPDGAPTPLWVASMLGPPPPDGGVLSCSTPETTFGDVCVLHGHVVGSRLDGSVDATPLDASRSERSTGGVTQRPLRRLAAPRLPARHERREGRRSGRQQSSDGLDKSRSLSRLGAGERRPLAASVRRLVVGDSIYRIDRGLRKLTDRVGIGLPVEAAALIDDRYVAVAAAKEGVVVLRILDAGVLFYARLLANDVPTHAIAFHADWLAVSRGGSNASTRELTVWSLARASRSPEPMTAPTPRSAAATPPTTKPLCFFLRHRSHLTRSNALALAFRERRRSLSAAAAASADPVVPVT